MTTQNKHHIQQFLLQSQSQSQYTNHDNNPHIFSNNFQFLISIVGATVGFGSFWRFPYLIYKNGGGAFFIPYLIALIIIGIPILYLQLSLGQIHQISIPFIFNKIHPSLKMIGFVIILNSFHLSIIYNLLMTYSYRLIFSAFNMVLPFSSQSIQQNTYFHEQILQKSESIEEFVGINPGLLFFYFLSLLICYYIIKNGVKASENVINFTAISPFVILTILLIRGLFLDGSTQGISYLLEPKWQKLSEIDIWVDAFIQVFYQLSLGLGMVINMASMHSRRNKITLNALVIPLSNLLCGMLSSFSIFLYLSHFCKLQGITIDNPDLKLYGPDLSFNIFPKALATLPLPHIWIFIFFSCMVFLGIDSLFGMLQAIYCYLRDQFKHGTISIFGIDLTYQSSQKLCLCLFMLICPSLVSHAGIYYLQFYDYYISNIPFALCVVIELVTFVQLFKYNDLQQQIVKYTKQKPLWIIKFILEKHIPTVFVGLMLIFAIFKQIVSYNRFPFQFYLIGWVITLYPYIVAYRYYKSRWTRWQDMKLSFKEDRPSYL